MKVILRTREVPDGRVYWSLCVGQSYEVLGIVADDYRLLDHTGEPILFDPECFEVVDPVEPEFWRTTYGEDGDRTSYPPGWGVPGVFEAWFDGSEVVREVFEEQLAFWYPGVAGDDRHPERRRRC